MYLKWTGILKLSRLIIRINLFLTEHGQAEIAKNNAWANYLPVVDKAMFSREPLSLFKIAVNLHRPSVGIFKRTQQENEREENTPK